MKVSRIMSCRLFMLFLAMTAVHLSVQHSMADRTYGKVHSELLRRFDADGDGRLSDVERKAMGKAVAQRKSAAASVAKLKEQIWNVDGVERRALLHVPAESPGTGLPLVFAFHGHGGSAKRAATSFRFHQVWPEALVVYMEGLPTPGRLTDPQGKKRGWQHVEGEQDDRDLKFFDAVWKSVQESNDIDEKRVFSTGHSNGGAFTFLMWGSRTDVFTAFAPCAASWRNIRTLTPKPAMHLAGTKDPLVKYARQEFAMKSVFKTNGCEGEGRKWAEKCTIYTSRKAAPFVTYIHDGGHEYPAKATELIVKFFKEQGGGEGVPNGL